VRGKRCSTSCVTLLQVLHSAAAAMSPWHGYVHLPSCCQDETDACCDVDTATHVLTVLTVLLPCCTGPVIIEAAAGQEYAVLGILATAAMYFQQLPLAALLFEAQRWGMFPRLRGIKGRLGMRAGQPSSSSKRDPHSRSDDALQVLAASEPDQDMMPDSRRRSHSGSVSNGSSISSSSSGSSFVAQFLLKNPVMWATGLAVVLSLCGAHSYLDPSGPAFIKQLGWVEGVLAWFGRCTTPLTLFSAGAWMHGKSLTANEKRQVAGYVGLRLLVLPPVMMVLAYLCNVSQKEGITLVIIASVPIAQVAYLVSEQYGVNTEAVTSVMILGLLALLPHMLLVLGLVEWTGLFAGR
jgi:predicted permease